MLQSFSNWLESKKKSTVVHHDFDTWLNSVDELKKELKKLKEKLAKDKVQVVKKSEKDDEKPEDKAEKDVVKKPEEPEVELIQEPKQIIPKPKPEKDDLNIKIVKKDDDKDSKDKTI